MKIRKGMTSGDCFENKWFYMKYIGKYLSEEILLTRECTSFNTKIRMLQIFRDTIWHIINNYKKNYKNTNK